MDAITKAGAGLLLVGLVTGCTSRPDADGASGSEAALPTTASDLESLSCASGHSSGAQVDHMGAGPADPRAALQGARRVVASSWPDALMTVVEATPDRHAVLFRSAGVKVAYAVVERDRTSGGGWTIEKLSTCSPATPPSS